MGKLPFFLSTEKSKLTLQRAADDIPDSEEIRALIKDIWELREKKIQQGLQTLDQHYLQVLACVFSI